MTDIRSDGGGNIVAQPQICDQSLAQGGHEPALRRGRYRRDVNPRESPPTPERAGPENRLPPTTGRFAMRYRGHFSLCCFTDTTTEQRFLLGHPVNEERGTQKRIDSGWDDNYG